MEENEVKKGQILYCSNNNISALFIPYASSTNTISKIKYKEFIGISIFDYGSFTNLEAEQTIHASAGFKFQYDIANYHLITIGEAQQMINNFFYSDFRRKYNFIIATHEKGFLKNLCKFIEDKKVKRILLRMILSGE